jgi:dolichol-phosphate mannosyltransferase
VSQRVLVVVPAYNEADTIEEVVTRALRHADVCVVDDASTDATGEIVAEIEGVHCIRHERNTHIAGGILDGFRYGLEAGYDFCITMDAGLSHDPDALPSFIARGDADLVLGYRTRRENVPPYRVALSEAASAAMNMALARRPLPFGGPGLRDCTSGYRMYSRRACELLVGADLRSRAFDFHIESLAVVYRAGYRIEEVPITYRFTNSSLRWAIVWEALRTWAGLWTRDLR